MKTFVSVLATALTLAASAHAATVPQSAFVTLFQDDFEHGLSRWTDRNPSSPDARVVEDPKNDDNHVLSFNRTMGAGSIFSNDVVVSSGMFTLSFDYLGRPGRGGVAGDLGGYAGVSEGFWGSAEFWVAGTGSYVTPVNLIDDGRWHSYSYTFNSPIGGAIRVKFEDWSGSNGVAGDAYFDNVRLSATAPARAVPEPSALALVAAALLGAGLATRRRGA